MEEARKNRFSLFRRPVSRFPIQVEFVFPGRGFDFTRVKLSPDIRVVIALVAIQRDFDVIYAEGPIPPESNQAVTR